jgi:hypothetical protein
MSHLDTKREMLTGFWIRSSNFYVANGAETWMQIQTGSIGSVILSVTWQRGTAGGGPIGGPITTSDGNLVVKYKNPNFTPFQTALSILNPWIDIVTIIPYSTMRYVDVPPHRIAVGIRTSTYNPIGDVYSSDGIIRLYVDDILVGEALNLQFMGNQLTGPGTSTYVAYGVHLSNDRVWVRNGLVTPSTTTEGALVSSGGLVLYDDFVAGSLSAWTAHAFIATTPVLPNMVSNQGGSSTYGMSWGSEVVTDLVEGGVPNYLPFAGIVLTAGFVLPPLTYYSGIYTIVPGKTDDTINNNGAALDLAIPDPSWKTGLLG